MAKETEKNRRHNFVTSFLPWLAGAVMLVVYVLTLSHGVPPASMQRWLELSGWNWRPEFFGPVTFLATYPFRWLPATILPHVLNLFSAVCAALTLALLARSVSLLPHDRTYDQRLRELSESSILTIRASWVPPIFAVLVCGLQMTFWENSIAATGEMFDLLIFAYCIRCLLEYRIDQRDSWLVRGSLVFGLGMANNWAMIGFFPAFLVAMIWIKGLSFFNVRFLLSVAGCGLAGLCLILLMPLVINFSNFPGLTFGKVLHFVLSSEKNMLFRSVPRGLFFVLSLTSLLPMILIGIRWAAHFGDNSPLGIFLATSMFYVVHGAFLLACLWVALDAPFSPREAGRGIPFLTFYYLGALSVGYFSGYFLLVFGTRVARGRRRPHPFMRAVNVAVTAVVWLLVAAVPAALVYKNLRGLQEKKADLRVLDGYYAKVRQALPPAGAVVLSDDSVRLDYLLAALEQKGVGANYLLVDTGTIGSPAKGSYYFEFLNKKYPQYNLSRATANKSEDRLHDFELVHLLEGLSAEHSIYYLHPSFGYYFERFYPESHGLVYEMRLCPTNVWLMPPPAPAQISENQAFWKNAIENDLPSILKAMQKPESPVISSRWQRFVAFLTAKPDLTAAQIGGYYSQALDYWGVELGKAGMMAEAGESFEQAQKFNPGNVSARINAEFNRNLLAGKEFVIQSSKAIADSLGGEPNLTRFINRDGPFDDPSFCLAMGTGFTKSGLYREAVQQFDRVRALAPDDTAGNLLLAQLFIIAQKYPNSMSYCYPYAQGSSNALDAANRALSMAPDNQEALFLKSATLLELGSYTEAIPILTRLLSVQTNNNSRLSVQFNRAIAYLHSDHLEDAKRDYEVLAKANPKVYQIYYGLAEIAYRQKDSTAAVKNYELYLANAPAGTHEAEFVNTRLQELKKSPP